MKHARPTTRAERMSRGPLEMADPEEMLKPMGVETLASAALIAKEEAHERELDEMIRMGWGEVEQTRIPPDWRTRSGPDTPERRANKVAGIISANRRKSELGIAGFRACRGIPRGRGLLYAQR